MAVQNPAAIKSDILTRARSEGFDLVRFTDAAAGPENATRLQEYLDAGHHGAMGWMADRAEWRADPLAMWPQAKSVIVLGLNYGPAQDPLAVLAQRTVPRSRSMPRATIITMWSRRNS